MLEIKIIDYDYKNEITNIRMNGHCPSVGDKVGFIIGDKEHIYNVLSIIHFPENKVAIYVREQNNDKDNFWARQAVVFWDNVKQKTKEEVNKNDTTKSYNCVV